MKMFFYRVKTLAIDAATLLWLIFITIAVIIGTLAHSLFETLLSAVTALRPANWLHRWKHARTHHNHIYPGRGNGGEGNNS